MRNTPKSLNEELNRMKKLMTFNVSENSHDVLSENFVKKSTISEQGEKEEVETEVEGEDCVTISHVGRFPVDGIAGSGAFTTFMNKIETTIKGNAKLADKITKGFVYVTDFSLIGGASNHYEGHSVTPEKNNDRKSDYSGQDYTEDNNKRLVGFEIKPEVRSIGEVLRQFQYYKSNLPKSTKLILVTKTTGLKEIFESQGFYVYEYQELNKKKKDDNQTTI